MATKQETKTKVKTKTSTLTPLEEQVVRMRRGLQAPKDLPLEQVGQDHPDTRAQLASIEARALASVGARQSDAKRHIVSELKRKG